MKFNIRTKTLLSQLVVVGKAIASKSTLSILNNFLMELDGETLTITGSDVDNVVTTRVSVQDAEGSGKFCIDAKRTTELMKAAPDGLATIIVDEATLAVTIKYTKGKFNLMGIKGDEYPLMEQPKEDAILGTITLPASQIINALDKVSFAAGTDDFRPQMQGVYWDIMEDAIVFVATDTRVLGKYRDTQTIPNAVSNFILSNRAIPLVRNIIAKEANVKIVHDDKSIFFEGENFTMRTAKVNGNYPNYNRVIPTDSPNKLTADRFELLDAVERVSLCADTTHALIKLSITPTEITVTAQDFNYSIAGTEQVSCDYNGNDMEIGFAAGYLKDVLKAITTQNISIRLSEPGRPAVFLPTENDEHGELTTLCMPLNIQPA